MTARGVALLAVAAALAAPLACFVARAPFGGYACDTAHGCVDGQTCFRGACVAACTTVADCADGLACVEGACTDAAPDALDAGTGDAGSVDAGDVDGGDVDGGDVDGGDADGGSPADAGPDAGTLCYGDPPECFPAAIVVTVCPGERERWRGRVRSTVPTRPVHLPARWLRHVEAGEPIRVSVTG
mgnify:CR=1 FL=1